MDDAGELLARGELGGLHAPLVDLAVGEILEAEADAAHVHRLGELRLEAGADDDLGGAAADVDHQAARVLLARRGRHRVRDAEITSIGKPRMARASRRNCGEFFATRSALVPTARTAGRAKPRSRSAKRARVSSAADCVARSIRFSAVRPAPRRTTSRNESRG